MFQLESLDAEDPTTQVNNWVADKTNGKIESLFGETKNPIWIYYSFNWRKVQSEQREFHLTEDTSNHWTLENSRAPMRWSIEVSIEILPLLFLYARLSLLDVRLETTRRTTSRSYLSSHRNDEKTKFSMALPQTRKEGTRMELAERDAMRILSGGQPAR